MSTTDQTRTAAGTDTRAVTPTRRVEASTSEWRETKPSPKTTELWLTIAGIAAIAVIYNASSDASRSGLFVNRPTRLRSQESPNTLVSVTTDDGERARDRGHGRRRDFRLSQSHGSPRTPPP